MLKPTPLQAKAWHKVLQLLSIRDHSPLELKQKLTQKGHPPQDTKWAIERAMDKKIIKPPQELSLQHHRALSQRHKGHHYIQHYLRQKGLPPTPFDAALERQKALILLQIKKNLDTNAVARLSSLERTKLQQWLSRRGFDTQTLREI